METKVLNPTLRDMLPTILALWSARLRTSCLFHTQTHKQFPPHQKHLSLIRLVDIGDNIVDMFAPSRHLFLVH